MEEMDHTAESLPPEDSEFDSAGLTRAACRQIAAPRVEEAAITMECELYDSIEIHDRIMVLGEVQYFHVDDDVLTDGQIDMRNIATVGRLGGPYYAVSDPVEFERQF